MESGKARVLAVGAAPEEVAESAANIAVVDDVLGHGVEERSGIGFERLLRAVPPGVAVEPCHRGIVHPARCREGGELSPAGGGEGCEVPACAGTGGEPPPSSPPQTGERTSERRLVMVRTRCSCWGAP